MVKHSFGQRQVSIPEQVIIWRVPKQEAIIGRDNLEIIRVVSGQDSIKVFINGSADDQATIGAIVGLQVGTTSSQTDTHRGPGY